MSSFRFGWVSGLALPCLVLPCLVIGFLFLAAGYPIEAVPLAAADDALFFRGVEQILQGAWLGPYDSMTLAKGPLLPIMGATAAWIGIGAKTLEAVLYLAAAISFSALARRAGLARCLVPALILFLLFSPHFWSEPGRRFLREVLYSSLALMTFGLFVSLVFVRNGRAGMLCALGAGFFFGLMYLTREEDIWMQSCLLFVLALAAVRAILRHGPGVVLLHWRSILIRAACVFSGLAVILPVLALNYAHYGRATVSEFRAPEFEAAVGALMRVGEIHPSGMVPVPQSTMTAVVDRVPAAASLRSHWPQVSEIWAIHGAKLLDGYPGEIAGGWFAWAFRDATARAGHYPSAQAARAFYAQLAAGVNAACDSDVLICRSRRDTLRPELPPSRFPELVKASWRALSQSVSLSGGPVLAPRSAGDLASLERWAELIGPVVATRDKRETEIVGWIAHPTADPMIAMPQGTSLRISALSVYPGPDVVDHFASTGVAGLHATRFRMAYSCPDAHCTIAAVARGQIGTIALGEAAAGPLTLDGGFIGHLDSVQQHWPSGFRPDHWEAFRRTVISILTKAVQILVPILTVTATIGVLASLFIWRNEKNGDGLILLAVGAAVAVIGRCVIIAYIDITSWHAVDVTYLGAAYPFVIAYAIVGTHLLFKALWDKFVT